jgi:hypothetical protein
MCPKCVQPKLDPSRLKLSFFLLLIASLLTSSTASKSQDINFAEQKNRQESKAGNEKKGKAGEKEKTAKTSPDQPPVSTTIITPKPRQSTSDTETSNKKDNARDWFDWYTAVGPNTWSQWLLAILATIAAIAAWRTFGAMQNQLETAERAWVFVDFDKIYQLPDPFVEFDIVNSGKTPGHIKQTKVLFFDPSDGNTPVPWMPGPIPKDRMETSWSIAPGHSQQQRWDVQLDTTDFAAIGNESKRLTIYGFVLYDDIFGKRHRTTFYRIFSTTTSLYEGIFIIPPEVEPQPGQNEIT